MSGYISEIRAFAGDYAPYNWMICNGAQIRVSEYEALFSLIGTIYGGDGRTYFNIPDLRGRLLISTGKSVGNTTDHRLGLSGGISKVTLQTANIPQHNHAFTVSSVEGTTNIPSGNYYGVFKDLGTPAYPIKAYLPDNTSDTTQTTVGMDPSVLTSVGGNLAHENRQPVLAITYIICVQGEYPMS